MTTQIIRIILDQLKESKFIQEKHQEHLESKSVLHLFQNTPLSKLPDRYKLQFVNESWAGKALERIMKEEQDYLTEWKIEKIVDAASAAAAAPAAATTTTHDGKGGLTAREIEALETIQEHIESNATIVMYSFVDCPWCLGARYLLEEQYPDVSLLVVELEGLELLGKSIRAELALWTRRTSMPCIIVKGIPIGGYTDGSPVGPGLKELHESNQLKQMLVV